MRGGPSRRKRSRRRFQPARVPKLHSKSSNIPRRSCTQPTLPCTRLRSLCGPETAREIPPSPRINSRFRARARASEPNSTRWNYVESLFSTCSRYAFPSLSLSICRFNSFVFNSCVFSSPSSSLSEKQTCPETSGCLITHLPLESQQQFAVLSWTWAMAVWVVALYGRRIRMRWETRELRIGK